MCGWRCVGTPRGGRGGGHEWGADRRARGVGAAGRGGRAHTATATTATTATKREGWTPQQSGTTNGDETGACRRRGRVVVDNGQREREREREAEAAEASGRGGSAGLQ